VLNVEPIQFMLKKNIS